MSEDMDIYAKVDWAIHHGNMGPQSYKVMLEVRAELARLTRENEELRAMFAPKPANKTIDDLARVAFETSWAGFDTVEKWDGQPEEYKENWRRIVRAVLEANARKGADCGNP